MSDTDLLDALRAADPAALIALTGSDATAAARHARPLRQPRRRWAIWATALAAVVVVGVPAGAVATGFAARTGWFGSPNPGDDRGSVVSTESDDTEWLDLGADDLPDVLASLHPAWLPLAPGVTSDALTSRVTDALTRSDALAQETLVRRTYEYEAYRDWIGAWITAHETGTPPGRRKRRPCRAGPRPDRERTRMGRHRPLRARDRDLQRSSRGPEVSFGEAVTGDVATASANFAASRIAASEREADRAFKAAIAPLVPLLLRYFARRVTPADDAADCTSETLLALRRHRSRLPHSEDERRAWAYGIARKVFANHGRGRARRAIADDALRAAAAVPAAPIPDEAFIAAEALTLLSPADQELIRLVVWEELSVADAGRALGIHPGTARTRYSRALSRLRKAFVLLGQT